MDLKLSDLLEIANKFAHMPCCNRGESPIKEDDLKKLGVWPIPEIFKSFSGNTMFNLGWKTKCFYIYEKLFGQYPTPEYVKRKRPPKPCDVLAEALKIKANQIEHERNNK